MPPKSSSKSPKGTVKPRTPATSLRGSGTSTTANPFGALNDESVAADDGHVDKKEGEEHDHSEDDEQQVFFGSVVESEANALLDRIESMHGHSSGDPYFPLSVRQDFVELCSGLDENGYNDDDKSAVAEMLKAGVSLQSLKDTLPALGKPSSSSGLSQKSQPGESHSHQAKVQAIRSAAVPSVEEVRSIFKCCVTGNGQTATQAFLPQLNKEFKDVLASFPSHVGLHAQRFPPIEALYESFTASGVLALAISVNPTASLRFAFKDSGSVAVSEPVVNTTRGAAQENDSTDIEKLLLKSEAHGVSGAASKAQLASITANRRLSLFFTESNDIRMNGNSLDLACSSLYTQIQDRFTLPVKYIEGMLLLNELVLLLMRFLKVVFKAFPLLFVGLEQKFDDALKVASQVSRHPRSQVNLFESLLQHTYDISCTRLLPYIAQQLMLRLQPHGYQIGSFNAVRDIYSITVNGSSPVFAQLVAFTKQVNVATANTPIPKDLPPDTQCHPALLPQCMFELFVTQLGQYRSSVKLDASTKLALEEIFKSIASGVISSLEQLRAVIEDHSQRGLFPIVDSKKIPGSSVALISQASSGNPSVPRGAPPGTCVQFWSKESCRFGDGCRYNHVSKNSNGSSIDSSVDTSKGKSPSADATSKSVKPSVKPSSFPPALSKAQATLMEEYQSKMSTLQGYLRGAKSSPLFGFKHLKIGSCLRFVRVPGKDASGEFWDTFSLVDECELPEFDEIVDLVRDVRRLHVSLKPSLLSAKDIPFPSFPQTILPPSLQIRSGVRGNSHASANGKGKGHGYGHGKGSNYDWSSPPNPQTRRGHGGNSFLSAAEEWQAWNAAQQPPPPQYSPYGPPHQPPQAQFSPYGPSQQPLPYDPELPAGAMASHQAMHMFLGQPSTSRPLSSSGGSVSSMQHRGSAASSQAQTVESSSQSFWASGPKPHGGGNGKGRDFRN